MPVTARFVSTDGNGTGSVPNPLTSSNPADYVEVTADFGFSTNFQSTSPFLGVFEGTTYAAISEENVGISPLGFYASPGFPGSPSNPRPGYVPNITTQLIQQLYTTGYVSLAQFTGDWEQDGTNYVFAIGRNTDAGQRFAAYLETGFDKTSDVRVYFPTIGGSPVTVGNITYGGTVTSQVPWPIAQQPGQLAVPLGSGGYNSGANLARVLTVTLTEPAYTLGGLLPDATAGYYVGYVTPGDANNRILGLNNVVPLANRGVALRLNGVELTTDNVKKGIYTAWPYNRLIRPQGGVVGTDAAFKDDFADELRDQIAEVDAPAGGGIIDDATVKVKRDADGGAVIKK